MNNSFIRTEMLLGSEAMKRLHGSRVAVFGVGGVGGFAAEAIARSGVGAMDLIDYDTVDESNLNRQIIATRPDIGRSKVDVMKERILSINPDCLVTVHNCFFLPETKEQFDFSRYSYVVDAVDTVTAKIEIVMEAARFGVPVISSMGAGNKLDPTRFEVADIYETSVCPLARVMRRELKKRGIPRLKVVYSKETALTPLFQPAPAADAVDPSGGFRKTTPGSVAFVPSVAGLIIGGEVIKDLAGINGRR